MNDTLLRQWSMLRHIPRHPRKIDPTSIKERLEGEGYAITLRSIQRDLNKLASVFPLMADDAKPQGWSWQPQAPQLDLPTLDPQTALTFNLVQAYLQKLLPASTIDFLRPWFQSAEDVLNAHGNGLSKWPDKIRVLPRGPLMRPPAVAPDVQGTIYEALLHEKQAEVRYQARSSGSIRDYRIHPLAIVVMEQFVYLVCTMRDYKDIRHLALHRIISAQLLDAPITRTVAFDLDRYISDGHFGFSLGRQSIKLDALFKKETVAHLLECPISADQTVADPDDDWVAVSGTLPDTAQLRWWLHGYGANVRVTGPEHLRIEFEENAAQMASLYGKRTRTDE